MLLREPLTSSMIVLLLARGANSAPAVGYSVVPAVSNAVPFESCVSWFVRHLLHVVKRKTRHSSTTRDPTEKLPRQLISGV